MNFEQLQERCRERNDVFLDTVHDQSYYPAFLHEIEMVDYHLAKQWIEASLEEKNVEPTKAIEANYMIGPNI
ncbi:MAG: hypothetical protein LBH96_05175 [Candidatus Peribacteria bacterium]|jgi:hypothetical protein|nr:hypothetical protein [Candidatus Peribacteria bacterium]